MKIIYHKDDKVASVADETNSAIMHTKNMNVVQVLMELGKRHPDEILVWCHEDLKSNLAIENIERLFPHKKRMVSYNPSTASFLGSSIGYVDETLFININRQVTFPTWLMSGAVGAVHASVINVCYNEISPKDSLDYFLNSFAKRCMLQGLWCYSEPALLKNKEAIADIKFFRSENIFRFVMQHYRTRWILLLLANLMYHERKFPIVSFWKSFFYKKRFLKSNVLDAIGFEATQPDAGIQSVDVIIPTIGRKKYLYDILSDLKQQAHLPANVIIVEQNPAQESESELDYLDTETWPFTIKHEFIHQAGACNARNIGLGKITSKWVFLADDDIRITPDFIQKAFASIHATGAEAVSINCLQIGDKESHSPILQWPYFGSGCSMVLAENIKDCRFSMGYEFGFCEDIDFGMQLRNKGCDILYLPEPAIIHLKAPVGGFRTKPVLKWSHETIQPKPSPTVILYDLRYNTKEQVLGYKMTLFLNYYKHQHIKNPLLYYLNFKKKWNKSVYWANQLMKEQ